MRSLAAGTGVPEESLSTDFHKAVQILEEAVRGFDIRPGARHTHFWADKTRDEFLATTDPAPPVQRTPQGGFDFDPNRSMFIKRLESNSPSQQGHPHVTARSTPRTHGWIRAKCFDRDHHWH